MNRINMNSFESIPVIDKIPQRIECIDTWEFRGSKCLFLGTSEGHLLIYDVTEKNVQGRLQTSVMLKDTKQISKKTPITQMNVFDDFNILVVLTDSEIRVFNLVNFSVIAILQKTKGCNTYAFSYKAGEYLHLVAAVKKKLVLYSWDGSDFIEIKEFNIPDIAKNLDFRDNAITVCFKKAYNIISTQDGSAINVEADKLSFTIFVQEREFLIVKQNMAFFINTEGSPNRRHSMTWLETPSAMAIHYPFAISIEPKQIEVQIIPDPKDPKTISQSLFLQGCKSITVKKDIYVSSPVSVWRLAPMPLMEIVDQMVNNLEYETAINLLSNTQENIPGIKDKLIKIKTKAAYHLFSKEQYESAMNYFESAQVDPLKIISLYPGLLPANLQQKLSVPFQVKDTDKNSQALKELEKYLVGCRKNKMSYTPPELSNSDYDLPTLVDTTLLKVYIKGNPQLIPHLFKVKNYCHIEESQRVLLEEKKLTELVLLYKSKELHREALTLLAKTSSPKDTINYLCQLGKQNMAIILEHSKWVLQKCPDDALAIFTTERKEDSLPPSQIIPHLKHYAQPLLRQYLEYIINDPLNPDKTPEFHNDLVFEYLNAITELIKPDKLVVKRIPGQTVAGTEPGLLGILRKKLIHFLETSKYYLPEKMLSRFPFDDLYEERAILLSRIGRHESALAIYAHKLKNFQMAEDYCDRHYNKDSEDAKDVYLSLMNVYLKTDGVEPLIDPALRLLNKHYRSINTPKALNLLPTNIPIDELYPFLEAVIRDNTKTKRDNQIIKNLFKSEHIKIKEELIHLRSGVIKITDDLNCAVCGKKFLGTQAFAAQPNGTAVHYVCFKQDKYQQQQYQQQQQQQYQNGGYYD